MILIDRCRPIAELPPVANAVRGELIFVLKLRHGGVPHVTLRYELVGRGDAPVLMVAGGISASRHVVSSDAFPEPGWWQAQSPSFDTAHFRVLAFDWIGADGLLDLAIDPTDQVDAIIRLLDHLEIDRIRGFIGASYGGMVGLHLAARHPSRCGALLALSASGAAHPFASACRSLQRRALALGDPASGVALARAMAMLTYRTPTEFAERFTAPACVEAGRVRIAADDYLDAQGQRHVRRMSATAYRRLSESIDLHRIDPVAVTVPTTFVAVDSDALVPTSDIEAFASAMPGAVVRRIVSRFGHDAFLKEDVAVADIITHFLSSLEHSE